MFIDTNVLVNSRIPGAVKMGIRNRQQRYLCRGCKKAFRASGKAQGRWMDTELMGYAIRGYYTGKSYEQIAEGLQEEYDLAIANLQRRGALLR